MAPRKPKTVPFTPEGIDQLPKDKPSVYTGLDAKGNASYVGSAKRGRVGERLGEHLRGGPDPLPGVIKVRIQQYSSITDARAAEARAIKRLQPRLNKKGK